MNKNKMFVLIGIPGAGKSTWATAQRLPVISSDAIRGELYGDESVQGDGALVFSIVHKRLSEAIKHGDTIFDATNVSRRSDLFTKYGDKCDLIAVYFDTPLEVAKERNHNRSRVVPDFVIERMAKRLVAPKKEEGWKEIIVVK